MSSEQFDSIYSPSKYFAWQQSAAALTQSKWPSQLKILASTVICPCRKCAENNYSHKDINA